jgi:hypothetical protein
MYGSVLGMKITIKNLMEKFGISRDSAKNIYLTYKRYKDGEISPRKVLRIFDTEIEGYGVECIRSPYYEEKYGDCCGDDCCAEYVSMGDTYKTTILYDRRTGSIQITTWGDWYERWYYDHDLRL